MKKLFSALVLVVVVALSSAFASPNPLLLEFVIENEGFTACSKWDNRQWSWGYGTKAPGPNLVIDKETAYLELWKALNRAENQVINELGSKYFSLTVNQRIALIDLAYNVGSLKKFNKLKKFIRENRLQEASNELSLTSSNPSHKRGLKARSKRRKALWLTP